MKKDPTKCNFLYICVFILLSLSSNRDFAMALNDPYSLQLQFDLKDFEGGSYADLTFQVIQRMVKVGPGILRPLYKSLVSVISNTAPYVKSLSKDSAESIFSLIKTFSNPELLRKREETSRILGNLFEAVNYVLLYHDEGNEEFLVSLIKYREIMKIADLKLADDDKSLKRDLEQPLVEGVKQIDNGHEEEKDKAIIKSTLHSESSELNSVCESKDVEQEPKIEENKEVPQPQTESNSQPQPETDTNEQRESQISEEVKQTHETTSSITFKATQETEQTNDSTMSKDNSEKAFDESKEENESMVEVPLDDIKHQQTNESAAVSKESFQFLSQEWEKEWKNSLNLPNLKQAIQYTDDKARAFLAKNPSPDNNIDADKFVEFLKKSSLKGLLPNQVKILVTTYNGNNSIDTWAISYIWGQIFMRQQDVPLFNIDSIKMFKVNYVNQQ